MTGKQKFSLLSKPGIEDRIQPGYRSMRYDMLIWKDWLEIDEPLASRIGKIIPGGHVNPGNFALFRLNENLVEDGYPESKIETALLEECMNEYQLFLQDTVRPIDVVQAAKLAVVLIEKRKISDNWSSVLSEISARFRGKSIEEFIEKWRSVIGIIENLIQSYEELIIAFCLPEASELIKSLFIPAIMMLGQPDATRIYLAKKAIKELKVQDQLAILTEFVEIGENAFAQLLAEELITKYKELEVSSSPLESYWDRPFESQLAVPFNQCVALIAHIAGNEEFEEKLLAKSEEIVKAAHAGIELQRAGIKRIELDKSIESEIDDSQLPQTNSSIDQLSFFEGTSDEGKTAQQESVDISTGFAKKIADSGNKEIAFQTIMNDFSKDPQGFIEKLTEKKPRFDPTWQTSKTINDLLEIDAYKPAEKLTDLLMKKNPVNSQAIQQTMKIKKAMGSLNDYVELLEGEVYCGKPKVDDFRELISCDVRLGREKEAFEASELLLQNDAVNVSDRIQHASLAVKNGKKEAARKILERILEVEPENVDALCALGEILIQEKDFEKAILELTRAAELSEGKASPWILLSECYSNQNETPLAVDALKKGIIALPGSKDIKIKLAELMMDQGMTAEALPLLQELSSETGDVTTDLTLLKALNNLHHSDIDEYVTDFYSTHPDEPEFCYQFADLKLRYGDYKEATKILKSIQSKLKQNPDWAGAYADAIAGLDPRFSKNAKQLQDDEVEDAIRVISSSSPSNQVNKVQYQCIKAELLIQKGLVEEAHQLLKDVFENGNGLSASWFTRMQTWFAWTSAALGKIDIALSTIRDVIDSDPTLLGAQQVLAEILALSDQTQEALEQAQLVIEFAPDLAENLLWAGEFFNNLGETDKALQVLSDGSKIDPEDIRFDLSIAQLYGSKGEIDKERDLIESLKGKIDQKADSKTLAGLTKLLDTTDDSSLIESILQQKFENRSDLQNALNLAGYEYLHKDLEKALEVIDLAIEKISKNQVLLSCKADILIGLARNDEALQVLENASNELLNEHFEINGFIPSSWVLIQQNMNPIDELKARANFEMGDTEESEQSAMRILEKDPGNPFARLIGIESAYARLDQEKVSHFNNLNLPEKENPLYPFVVVEKMELLLDENNIDGCWEIYNSLDERVKKAPVIRVVESNLLFLEGNLREAEEIFLDCVSKTIDINNSSILQQIINSRVMVKTAVRLAYWDKAVNWINKLSRQFAWNKNLNELYLSTLVRAIEFKEYAETLDIKLHSSYEISKKIDSQAEIDWINQNLDGNTEAGRWVIRWKLAIQPDQKLIRAYALNKPTAEDAVVLIRALSKIGQEATAEQIGRKFSKDESVLFECAFQEKDSNVDSSLVKTNKLLELKATNPLGLALRSQLFEKSGKKDQAVHDIESALVLWPNEFNWHKKASDLWNSLGNEQKAIQHLEYVKDQNPHDYDTGLKLAKSYLGKNDYQTAIDLLTAISREEPNKSEVWECLSDAQFETGHINEALDSAEKAIKVNPFSIKPYLLKAQVDLDNGLIEKAYEQVKLADEMVKDDGEVKVFLAKVLIARGEKAAALAALEDATHCQNLNPKTILEEIRLIKSINGTSSARSLIEYFAKQMPENTELLSLLAESQLENGDSHGAEVTARRVLKLKPDSVKMLLFIGKQQLKKGQLDQAIHSFSQVVNLDSKNLDGFYCLSDSFVEQREISKATETLNRIIEIDPGQTDAYLKLAAVFKDAKNYKSAEEMLKKAVELEPKNVAIKRQLGALLALNLVHQSQEVSSQL
jgi:tetratricopeptide (TPR) repeat protein